MPTATSTVSASAERNRRYRAEQRAKRDPKFYLLEANQLFDRIAKAPPDAAQEIFHLIALEASKRARRLDRQSGNGRKPLLRN